MLIVCPSCATSYMIDPASVGATGRAVRCARCRSTWFVNPGKSAAETPNVSAFVSGVIAEAEADAQNGNPGKIANIESPPPVLDATPSTAPEPPEPSFNETAPPVIADAPTLVPPDDHDGFHNHVDAEADAAAADHPDVDEGASYAARRARVRAKRQKSQRNSRWIAIILVLFVANIAIIAGRHQIVRYLPQTASLFASIGLPVNLRNLEFEGIRIAKETQDGVTILIIEGKIVNTVGSATDVPRLRFAARNASGQEVYTWSMQPTRSILGPGDTLPFTSRLAAPPADAVDILVRFFTKQDAASGLK